MSTIETQKNGNIVVCPNSQIIAGPPAKPSDIETAYMAMAFGRIFGGDIYINQASDKTQCKPRPKPFINLMISQRCRFSVSRKTLAEIIARNNPIKMARVIPTRLTNRGTKYALITIPRPTIPFVRPIWLNGLSRDSIQSDCRGMYPPNATPSAKDDMIMLFRPGIWNRSAKEFFSFLFNLTSNLLRF